MVSLLVEIPHSDLSKVTRMVLVHVRSVVVDHQQDMGHRDACGACLHNRLRQRHGRDCEGVSLSFVIFQSLRPCQCSITMRHGAT